MITKVNDYELEKLLVEDESYLEEYIKSNIDECLLFGNDSLLEHVQDLIEKALSVDSKREDNIYSNALLKHFKTCVDFRDYDYIFNKALPDNLKEYSTDFLETIFDNKIEKYPTSKLNIHLNYGEDVSESLILENDTFKDLYHELSTASELDVRKFILTEIRVFINLLEDNHEYMHPLSLLNNLFIMSITIDDIRGDDVFSNSLICGIKYNLKTIDNNRLLPSFTNENMDKFFRRKRTSNIFTKYPSKENLEISKIEILEASYPDRKLKVESLVKLVDNLNILISELNNEDIFSSEDINFLLNEIFLVPINTIVFEPEMYYEDEFETIEELNNYIEITNSIKESEQYIDLLKTLYKKLFLSLLNESSSDNQLLFNFNQSCHVLYFDDLTELLEDVYKSVLTDLEDYHLQGLKEFGFIDLILDATK